MIVFCICSASIWHAMPPTFPRHRKKFTYHPFWQSDKPYLHDGQISDFRFRLLGYLMSFLAGAINAGGFFAVNNYTSHVSGALSHAADQIHAGMWTGALTTMAGVVAFILGAAHANWIILWTKRQRFRSGYGLSMWFEAVYLLLFGLFGIALSRGFSVFHPTLLLLCFIMGMHNTVMTVLSGSVIRSTHMTGTVTDLGIELSKVLYYSRSNNPRLPNVKVNRPKMKLLIGMLLGFVGGGIIGTWGYTRISYHFTLPVAAILFLLGAGSVGYDVRIRLKWLLVRKLREHRKRANNKL